MRATPPAPPLSPGGVELVEQLDEEVLPNFAKPSVASIARATEVRNKKEADHESSLVAERARAAATFAANRASEQKRRPSRDGAPKPTPRYASPNAAAKVRQESTKAKSSMLDSIRQRTEQKEESDEWRKRREAAPPQANTARREKEVTPAYAMPTLSRVTTTAATTARRAATTASGGTLAGRLGGIGGTTTAQETQDESEVWKRNRAAAVAAAAATAAGRKAPPTPMYALPTRAAATRAATESVAPSALGTVIRGGAAARLREEEAKQQAEIFRRRTARKRAAKETEGGASTTVPRYAQPTQATGARRASASGPELAGRPVAIGESTRGGAYEKGKRAERDAERLAWRGRGSTKSPPASARFASATESSLQRSRSEYPPPTAWHRLAPPGTAWHRPPPTAQQPAPLQSRASAGRRDRADAPGDRLRQRADLGQRPRS